MPWTIEDRFKIAGNQAVVDFILRDDTLSAHDEVATALTQSAEGLSDVKWYCPDVHSYAYVVLHTNAHRIFGIAFGQRALAYRLPKERLTEAGAAGGKVYTEIGNDWVVFDPWHTDQPVNASHWCKIAHDHAVAPQLSGWQ